MIFARVVPLLVVAGFAAPPRTASTLTISVTSASAAIPTPVRVIANAGTVTNAGKTYRANMDTLRITGSAEFSTSEAVFAGTFLADISGARVSVTVRENGTLVASGEGEAIVVIRTPLGAQLQAMSAEVFQRTR
jgi:hypothetical protein